MEQQLLLISSLSISDLVSAPWASASIFGGSDNCSGANGVRIRLVPKDLEINQPVQMAKVLKTLKGIHSAFNIDQSDCARRSSKRSWLTSVLKQVTRNPLENN